MKRVLCEALPQVGKPRRLPDAEAHHLLRVLGLEEGDRVEALDGSGKSVAARVRLRSGEVWLEFDGGEKKAAPPAGAEVVLEMAVLKGDAMEWVIEKAVELGVSRVIPILARRTVVQVDRKGPDAFRERWQKIADQALKQCGRLGRMEVLTPVALESLLLAPLPEKEVRFFLDEEARASAPGLLQETLARRPMGTVRLLIGPEGGWDPAERTVVQGTSGARPVSLGPLVLRAETAAIGGVSILTAALRETHPSS